MHGKNGITEVYKNLDTQIWK